MPPSSNKTVLVWLVSGVVLAGISMIWLGDAIIGADGPIFVTYALLMWGWVRIVEVLDARLAPFIKDLNIRFSVSWLLPIMVVLGLGLIHIPLPVLPLAVAGSD